MRTGLRSERGGILVISALMMPVFLLLVALILDAGVWFTHKRSLQNRADAGALAAGVEYLSQLANCTNPATAAAAATAITNAAKQYGGATGATDPFNQTPSTQARTTVVVNASPGEADNTDGDPCQTHSGDTISPDGGVWTDVIAQERDIGTLAGAFGVNLNSITARARVQVNQLTGVAHNGLPFVNETGDQVECAWAVFVDAGTGGLTDAQLLGGTTNPVALQRDPNDPRHWTASVGGLDFRSDHDIAVQYWMGAKMGGSCDYDPTGSNVLAAKVPGLSSGAQAPIDYIRVFDDDHPGTNQAPLLHNFKLSGGSCGGPGFLYTASLLTSTTCTISFDAEVDSGSNPHPDSITVSSSNPSVSAVTATEGTANHYVGQLTFNPNEVNPNTGHSQSYTEVGLHKLSVSWRRTSGIVNGRTCRTNNPCTGTFESGACGTGCDETVAHATYVADPVYSSPIMSAELTNGAGTPIPNSYSYDPLNANDIGAFTIDVKTYGVDQQHTMLIREWNGPVGNRTFAIDCGQGTGTAALRNAVENGCPNPLGVNVRGDVCTPQPAPQGYRDCVLAIPGDRASLAQGYMDRFSCSDLNHWDAGSPANLSDQDPRYAYIFLTSWGRIVNAQQSHTVFPIKAFLRIYVTGWDRQGHGPPGPEDCAGNEKPPEPYTDQGNRAHVWGHFVDVITLSDDVLTGDEPCDMTVTLLTCKPQLVR